MKINLLLPKCNKEKIYHFICQFLIGMLGSLIVLFFYHLLEPQRTVVTVDVTAMINHFIKSEASATLPSDQLKKQVQAFGQALDSTLRDIAHEQRLILVPKEAVIAGAKDMSQEVEIQVKAKLLVDSHTE